MTFDRDPWMKNRLMTFTVTTEYSRRQMTSYEERGKKIRNKYKQKKFIKPPKPTGMRIGEHHDSCKILDDEYKTEWEKSFIFAAYCREKEDGLRWRDILDPPSWI